MVRDRVVYGGLSPFNSDLLDEGAKEGFLRYDRSLAEDGLSILHPGLDLWSIDGNRRTLRHRIASQAYASASPLSGRFLSTPGYVFR
jgi:hypothetical protein